jgi:hypothetical protein
MDICQVFKNGNAEMHFWKSNNSAYRNVLIALILLGVVLAMSVVAQAADGNAPAAEEERPAIKMIPGDGMNLAIDEVLNPYYIIVKLTSPAHNWFAGTFTNLPTDKDVTIGLSMEGNDTQDNKADVTKWTGLMPVMTYADPTKYETYEWYQKDDQGRWVSGDPFKQGEAKYAGTGKVPEQPLIPKDIAEQFLYKDGKYWQPWREVDNAEAVVGINTFRITQKFSYPTVTIAMRVPFTYTYYQQLLDKINKTKFPGVSVDEIGITIENRKIQVVRVDDPNDGIKLTIQAKKLITDLYPVYSYSIDRNDEKDKKRNVIINIAREHATEHSSSWVVIGALFSLLSNGRNQSKANNTWIFIPIEDIDGSYNSQFDSITSHFYKHLTDKVYGSYTPVEVLAYIRYLHSFVNAGYPIVSANSFHNVECNEGPNIFSPFAIEGDRKITTVFNKQLFAELQGKGFEVGNYEALDNGWIHNRLYAFCWSKYGSLALAFEVNDRYPKNRCDIADVIGLGSVFSANMAKYLSSDIGKDRITATDRFCEARKQRMTEYYTSDNFRGDDTYDLLTLGF